MTIDSDKILHDLLNSLDSLEGIRPEEIPNIALYMDQVTTFMDAQLASSRRFESDKVLTKHDQQLCKNSCSRASQKEYSPEHMMLLVFIYYFKTSSRSRISRHCSPRSPIGISARRAAFPSKISTTKFSRWKKKKLHP